LRGSPEELKEAGEKNPDGPAVFVSQVIEGGKGPTFLLTTLRSSMAGFDHNPTINAILAGRLQKFQQFKRRCRRIAESTLYRVSSRPQQPTDKSPKSPPILAPESDDGLLGKTNTTPDHMEPFVAKAPDKKPEPHRTATNRVTGGTDGSLCRWR